MWAAVEMDKKLNKLQGTLAGDKALIMGNGPSLAGLNLDLLEGSGLTSFATNRISLIYNKTSWRPDFYVCFAQLPLHHEEWRQSLRSATQEYKTTCFVHNKFSSFLEVSDNTTFVKNVHEHDRHSTVPSGLFSISPEDKFLKSFTSTVPLIQLCLYMGAKKIAIIGQDGYDLSRKENHFSKDYGFDPGSFEKTNRRFNAVHNVLKKHVEENDIQVYNLSQISILEHYPKITLEQFLEE